jgi:microcystin-dependent protein
MTEPFLSEIRIVSFNFPPKGWALCNGQLLPINQNQALFSLLGTTYGGDGRVNFALPDLRGRIPIHFGNNHTLGERAGEENHTLIQTEMPAHVHPVSASSADPNQGLPAGNMWANGSGAYSSSSPDSTMNPASLSNTGGSQPHTNTQPYLVLNYIIALQGIFPSQT